MFFVTGLPRSRTAWLANLLTTERSICWHEPTRPIRELVREAEAAGYEYLGVSDAALALSFEALRSEWPDARWLLVERNPEAALKSFVEWARRGGVELPLASVLAVWQRHGEARRQMRWFPNVLVTGFEDLGQPVVVASVCEHLLPGLELGDRWALRAGVLARLRVETTANPARAMAEGGGSWARQ